MPESAGFVMYWWHKAALRQPRDKWDAAVFDGYGWGDRPPGWRAVLTPPPWPDKPDDQTEAEEELLRRQRRPAAPDQLARLFKHARADRVADLLETLRDLGQRRRDNDGQYSD